MELEKLLELIKQYQFMTKDTKISDFMEEFYPKAMITTKEINEIKKFLKEVM